MQETTKECRKELQKHKVTNWVNGQRSRQFGMAGHVIRKTDGRWAKALINWYKGKPKGRNTTSHYWEHDIEAWMRQKFPLDHSTLQQLAKDLEKWTKWRYEYAAHWPSKSKNANAANTDFNQSIVHRAELETKKQKATKDRPDQAKKVPNLSQHNKKDHFGALKQTQASALESMVPTNQHQKEDQKS